MAKHQWDDADEADFLKGEYSVSLLAKRYAVSLCNAASLRREGVSSTKNDPLTYNFYLTIC